METEAQTSIAAVLTYPGFLRQLYKGLGTFVPSIKTPSTEPLLFLNLGGQMLLFFLRGWPQKRTRPADTKGAYVTCSWRNTVSELSAQSLGQAHSVKSILCPVLCVVFSLLFILCFIQGDILTFIRRVDENWIEAKLGEKVGFCPEQFTEVSFFSSLDVSCDLFSAIEVDTCR